VRIGRPLSVADQKEYKTLPEFSEFLRKKTYMLSSAYDKKSLLKNIPNHIKIPRSPKKIISENPIVKIVKNAIKPKY
jgi:hypothetical protein